VTLKFNGKNQQSAAHLQRTSRHVNALTFNSSSTRLNYNPTLHGDLTSPQYCSDQSFCLCEICCTLNEWYSRWRWPRQLQQHCCPSRILGNNASLAPDAECIFQRSFIQLDWQSMYFDVNRLYHFLYSLAILMR